MRRGIQQFVLVTSMLLLLINQLLSGVYCLSSIASTTTIQQRHHQLQFSMSSTQRSDGRSKTWTKTTATTTTMRSKKSNKVEKIHRRFIEWSQTADEHQGSHQQKILLIDGNNVRGMNKFKWNPVELQILVRDLCFELEIPRVVIVWDHGHHPSIWTKTYSHNDQTDNSNETEDESRKTLDMVVLFSGLTQRADDVLVRESAQLQQQFYTTASDNDEDHNINNSNWSSFAFVTSDRELMYKLQRQASLSTSSPGSKVTKYTTTTSSKPLFCDSNRFGELLKQQQHQTLEVDESAVLLEAVQEAEESIFDFASEKTRGRGRQALRLNGGEKTWQRCIVAELLRRAYDASPANNIDRSEFLDDFISTSESLRGYQALGMKSSASSLPDEALSKRDEVFGPARLDKKQRRLLQSYNKLMASRKPSSSLLSSLSTTSLSPNNRLLILGLGRVGLEVAEMAINAQGYFDEVIGTVRTGGESIDVDRDDASKFIRRISFDPATISSVLFSEGSSTGSSGMSHVLFTIPLSSDPDPNMQSVLDLVQNWFNSSTVTPTSETSHPPNPRRWLGLLSTTGVYGNHDGGWVTEESPLLCDENSNAFLYKQLEEDWIQLSLECQKRQQDQVAKENNNSPQGRLCIFRCAGIYDSSRSALHTVYKQGYHPSARSSSTDVSNNDSGTVSKTNRIHSSDLARAVVQSMLMLQDVPLSPPYRIYNLADDLPETRSVVLDFASNLLLQEGLICDNENKDEDGDDGASDDDTGSTAATTTTATTMAETAPQIESSLPTNSSTRRLKRRQRERKLVSNDRMKSELLSFSYDISNTRDRGLFGSRSKEDEEVVEEEDSFGRLMYPTYREGLQAIFLDPSTPWRNKKEG
jgi:nucleoside-diphosphate-sugar epimerase